MVEMDGHITSLGSVPAAGGVGIGEFTRNIMAIIFRIGMMRFMITRDNDNEQDNVAYVFWLRLILFLKKSFFAWPCMNSLHFKDLIGDQGDKYYYILFCLSFDNQKNIIYNKYLFVYLSFPSFLYSMSSFRVHGGI